MPNRETDPSPSTSTPALIRRQAFGFLRFVRILIVAVSMAFAALVVILAISTLLFLYWNSYTDYQDERTAAAVGATMRLVERFIWDNGRWPRSWKELEAIPPPIARIIIGGDEDKWTWPDASREFQKRVIIDFNMDPARAQAVLQNDHDFEAVRPRTPGEYFPTQAIPDLERAIREVILKQSKPETPESPKSEEPTKPDR